MKRLCAALLIAALAVALPAVVLGSEMFPKPPVPSSRDKITATAKPGSKTTVSKNSLQTGAKTAKTSRSTRLMTTKNPASLQ
jgi:electron transfer flavoprotein alpha/beta subunit